MIDVWMKGAVEMKIYHNDQLVGAIYDTDRDAVIAEIDRTMALIGSNDLVIKEVFVDGQDVTGQLEHVLASRLPEIREIRFITVGTHEMFASLVRDFSDYLPNVLRATESISDLFYGELDDNAWTLLEQLMESLAFVGQFLQTCKAHYQLTESGSFRRGQLTEIEQALAGGLNQFEQALREEDYVLAGDVLKYEIGELLQKLQQFLGKSELH